MSRSTTVILPLAVPAGVGAIIFASAGRWDLPFVWAILGLLAAFYLALAAFADFWSAPYPWGLTTVAVNNAYGFGGCNSSLVLRACGA